MCDLRRELHPTGLDEEREDMKISPSARSSAHGGGMPWRRFLRTGLLSVGLAPIAVLACGTQPLSEIVVEGTTVVIPIPSSYEVGFGTNLVSQQLPLSATSGSTITGPPLMAGDTLGEDLQRGEMLATLFDTSGEPVVNLPVRYVAAVTADPGAIVATQWLPTARQSALVVDIPLKRDGGFVDLVADGQIEIFEIRVRRFRRGSFEEGATEFVEQRQAFYDPQQNSSSAIDSEWFGWGQPVAAAPAMGIPITISDQPGAESERFTPLDEYWYAFNFFNPFTGAIAYISKQTISPSQQAHPIPDPRFVVRVDPGTSTLGAFSMDITYPANQIEITGVRANRMAPEGAWITHSTSPSSPQACTPAPSSGMLHVDVVDPDAQANGVIVSYRLVDDIVGCGLGPLSPADIAVASLAGYDPDGVEIAGVIEEPMIWSSFED